MNDAFPMQVVHGAENLVDEKRKSAVVQFDFIDDLESTYFSYIAGFSNTLIIIIETDIIQIVLHQFHHYVNILEVGLAVLWREDWVRLDDL